MRSRHVFKFHRGLAALAAVLCVSPALRSQSPNFIRGDINLDGQVTMADASYYFDFRFFGAPAPRCLDAMDVGDDGQIDSFGIGDGDRLLDWLFRDPSPPLLPAPFPAPGLDPTMDGLSCADPSLRRPGDLGREFSIAWEAPATARRGRRVELFVLVSTGAPIECFSIAFRADALALENISADFQDTVFPQAQRTAFEASPVFREAVVASADPTNFDLLEAGAVFIADGGSGVYNRILFAATQGRLRSARLLRVTANVRRDAPLGPRVLFQLPQPGDFLSSGAFVHGVKNELVVLDGAEPGQSGLPLVAPPNPTIIVDAEEFLRGDANLDLNLDISDPLAAIGFLFLGNQELLCPDSADANDDGQLDISDPSFLLNYLFLGQTAPPAPGPRQCGEDPTADGLALCPEGCV
jgi:hypothetical protein